MHVRPRGQGGSIVSGPDEDAEVAQAVEKLRQDLETVQRDLETLARHVAGLTVVAEGTQHVARGELVQLHRVRCVGCGRTADTRTGGRSTACRRFERAGWSLASGAWECPVCVLTSEKRETGGEVYDLRTGGSQ